MEITDLNIQLLRDTLEAVDKFLGSEGVSVRASEVRAWNNVDNKVRRALAHLGEVEGLPTCSWCGKDTSMTCTVSELPVPECKNFH